MFGYTRSSVVGVGELDLDTKLKGPDRRGLWMIEPSKVPIMNGLTDGRQEILESGAICPCILTPDEENNCGFLPSSVFFRSWEWRRSVSLYRPCKACWGNQRVRTAFPFAASSKTKFERRRWSLKSSSASRAHLRQEDDFPGPERSLRRLSDVDDSPRTFTGVSVESGCSRLDLKQDPSQGCWSEPLPPEGIEGLRQNSSDSFFQR